MKSVIASRVLPGIGIGAVVAGSLLGLAAWESARAADGAVDWQLNTTAETTVNAGDQVTWTWGDALPHSVTSVSGPATFDSGIKTGADSTYSFTFTGPGTYTYRCNVHPTMMTGTVTVLAAATSTSTSTPSATATTPAATATTPAATATGTATTTAGASTPLAGASTITLSGGEEVPPVTTTATGKFEWKLEGNTLRYRLTATGPNLTMAHIHVGAKGANGPIVVSLFGPQEAGVPSIDVSGSVTDSALTGPLAGKLTEFLAALRAGNLYVNVHSKESPAGLVRAQIPANPGAPGTGSGLEGTSGGVSTPVVLAATGLLLAAAGVAFAETARRRRQPGQHGR